MQGPKRHTTPVLCLETIPTSRRLLGGGDFGVEWGIADLGI